MKLMRFIYGVAVAVMAVTIPACGGGGSSETATAMADTASRILDVSEIKREIRELNASMPLELEGGLRMTSVSLEDGTLVYTCQYPSTMEFEARADEASRRVIVAGLPEATRAMLRQAGLGLRYLYVREGSDSASQVIDIPASEIKSCQSGL